MGYGKWPTAEECVALATTNIVWYLPAGRCWDRSQWGKETIEINEQLFICI